MMSKEIFTKFSIFLTNFDLILLQKSLKFFQTLTNDVILMLQLFAFSKFQNNDIKKTTCTHNFVESKTMTSSS